MTNWSYDYLGRRVQKIVSTHSGGSVFVPQSTNRFVYDGWNVLAAVTPQLAPINSFLWGQDLSGTTDGAGGIGGLLLVTSHSATATNCFVAYDGNGNVMALVRSGTDPIAARYEYSPFGETLRMTGPLAETNPFRFSTKFADDESGLVYYGLRYYSPSLGRFLNIDPIEEEGGLNLYALTLNNVISAFDALGMDGTLVEEEEATGISSGIGGESSSQANSIYHSVRRMVDTFDDIQELTDELMGSDLGNEEDSSDLFGGLLSAGQQCMALGIGGHTEYTKRGQVMHKVFREAAKKLGMQVELDRAHLLFIDAFWIAGGIFEVFWPAGLILIS